MKRDILDLPSTIQNEIYADLQALQADPFPAGRSDLDGPGAYFHQLPCGYYVSWELIGTQEDILRLMMGRPCRDVIIRILGAGPHSPKK